MKGDVKEIYRAFDGIDKTLVIPVYQRNYDWTPKQCEKLFDDIETMIESGQPKHFFGAIVGYPEDSFTWVVIDGQQRMTTVSLFMLALVHAIEAGDISADDDGLARRLVRNYLESEGSGGQKFKLKPVKNDRDSYARLFGPEEYYNEKSKVTVNYRYFRQRLKETAYDATTLWNQGISQLEVMLLDLEAHDNPQRIFESLNSTGLALKESDKIRNFILMGLSHKEQNEVYEKFWNEMERNVGYHTDGFIRNFLVAQTAKTPRQGDIYEPFKKYAKNSGQSSREIAEKLFQFSIFSRELDSASTGFKGVDRRLRRANQILSGVAKPFVWLCYRDLKAEIITLDDFEALLVIIESYLFRRVISNVGTNSLNKIFSGAYNDLKKLRKNQEPYSDITAYLLLNRRGSGRFPDDSEFVSAFNAKDIYSMKTYRSYFFDVLEQGSTKDVRDIAASLAANELTVEHIMPQTLSKQWREELGPNAAEIHAVWLNRAANLTITGYNAEYSNRTFREKKTMAGGFDQSPYELNNYIKKQDEWGLTQLEERAEILARKVVEYWPFPDTQFQPTIEVTLFEPMGEDRNFSGQDILAVELEGTKYAVKTWKEMVVRTIRILLEQDRDGVIAFAESTNILESNEPKKVADTDSRWQLVDPALAVNLASSTNDKINLLRRICRAIGYDTDDILVYLRPKRRDSAAPVADDESTVEVSPFPELSALKPLIDELQGADLTVTDLSDEIRSLSAAIDRYPVASPEQKIGGVSLDDFLRNRTARDISPQQALACLLLYRRFAQGMGNDVWRSAIKNGTISTLLAALTQPA